MKNYIYIILIFNYSFCTSFVQSYNSDFYNHNYNKFSYYNVDSKSILKSAIFPGWGQYSSGSYKKAAIFLSIELVAFGIYYSYDKKSAKEEKHRLSE